MGLEVLQSHLRFLFCLFACVSMKMWSTGFLFLPFPLELKTKISLPHGPLKLLFVAVFFHNRKVTNILDTEFIQHSNHFIEPLKSVRGFNH